MIYQVTEVISQGTVQTRYGNSVKSVIKVEGWDKEIDYWGQTFVQDRIEGEIVPNANPKYNDTLKKAPQTKTTSTKPNFAKMSAEKQEGISRNMDKKFDGIARAGCLRNATELVTAMLNAGIIEEKSEEGIRAKVYEYSAMYEDLYYVETLPSNDKQPF